MVKGLDDVRQGLLRGAVQLPTLGVVERRDDPLLPFVVLDGLGEEIAPVSAYLRDLMVGDCSPLTCRSYGFDLLRWFRLLWVVNVDWHRATEEEASLLVSWLRIVPNPQRKRSVPRPLASVNVRSGKTTKGIGYSPATINHALTVIGGFYAFHSRFGEGPTINPVPANPSQRRALGHHNPLEPFGQMRRARLRQRAPWRMPRAIPDHLWDELFEAMRCDRDRALLLVFVSSGGRAAEVLGVRLRDIDWARQRVYVVSKGTRVLEPIPLSPEALLYLARYIAVVGPLGLDDPVWRTRRGTDRPLHYAALRRILQRANAVLGTDWTWHDLRHTAATRMVNDGRLTLPEVQMVLRHANIETTRRYLSIQLDDITDRLFEYYTAPRPARTFAAGHNADDVRTVFGG